MHPVIQKYTHIDQLPIPKMQPCQIQLAVRPMHLNLQQVSSAQSWMNSPKSQHPKIFSNVSIFQKGPSNNQYNECLSLKPATNANPEMLVPQCTPKKSAFVGQKMEIMREIDCENMDVDYQQMHCKLDSIEDRLNCIKEKMKKNKNKAKEKENFTDKGLQKNRRNNGKIQQLQLSTPNNKQNRQNMQTFKSLQSDELSVLVTQINCSKTLKSLTMNTFSSTTPPLMYYISDILAGFKQQNSLQREHIVNSLHQLKVLSKMKGPTQEKIDQKKIKLPRKFKYIGKKTIIFDLDETLIHCNQNSSMASDIKLEIPLSTGQTVAAGINIRPYAHQILKKLSKNFEIIIFTASHSSYASKVVKYMDPKGQYISHCLFREHCYQTPNGVFIKDLRIIDRDLSQTVLIDNAAYSYALQIQNGIPILPYYSGKTDTQLQALQKYIEGLLNCSDVRDINRNTFMLNRYHQFQHADALVKSLYADFQ